MVGTYPYYTTVQVARSLIGLVQTVGRKNTAKHPSHSKRLKQARVNYGICSCARSACLPIVPRIPDETISRKACFIWTTYFQGLLQHDQKIVCLLKNLEITLSPSSEITQLRTFTVGSHTWLIKNMVFAFGKLIPAIRCTLSSTAAMHWLPGS